MQVSTTTMSRAMHSLAEEGKKSLIASERDEAARTLWCEQADRLESRQLVVMDECGPHMALTPLYVQAIKGKRLWATACARVDLLMRLLLKAT